MEDGVYLSSGGCADQAPLSLTDVAKCGLRAALLSVDFLQQRLLCIRYLSSAVFKMTISPLLSFPRLFLLPTASPACLLQIRPLYRPLIDTLARLTLLLSDKEKLIQFQRHVLSYLLVLLPCYDNGRNVICCRFAVFQRE